MAEGFACLKSGNGSTTALHLSPASHSHKVIGGQSLCVLRSEIFSLTLFSFRDSPLRVSLSLLSLSLSLSLLPRSSLHKAIAGQSPMTLRFSSFLWAMQTLAWYTRPSWRVRCAHKSIPISRVNPCNRRGLTDAQRLGPLRRFILPSWRPDRNRKASVFATR